MRRRSRHSAARSDSGRRGSRHVARLVTDRVWFACSPKIQFLRIRRSYIYDSTASSRSLPKSGIVSSPISTFVRILLSIGFVLLIELLSVLGRQVDEASVFSTEMFSPFVFAFTKFVEVKIFNCTHFQARLTNYFQDASACHGNRMVMDESYPATRSTIAVSTILNFRIPISSLFFLYAVKQ